MKFLKRSSVVLALSFLVGCASTSDLENLQAQVDALKSQVSTAVSDAASAKSAADAASASAANAEAAANKAAQYAQDTNSKLDRMFKKSMMK